MSRHKDSRLYEPSYLKKTTTPNSKERRGSDVMTEGHKLAWAATCRAIIMRRLLNSGARSFWAGKAIEASFRCPQNVGSSADSSFIYRPPAPLGALASIGCRERYICNSVNGLVICVVNHALSCI